MNQEELLQDAFCRLGVPLEKKQQIQFLNYKDLLLEWNQKINLTAITEEKEIILKHFVDSISALPQLESKKIESVIDVGTGAGFPGIPLKIMRPHWKLTLLDSLQKRILFLEEVVNLLNLSQVECIHGRAEEVGQNPVYREKFDLCVSRAVANLAVLSEYCLPFVALDGYFVSLKGPDAKEEIKQAEPAVKKLGGRIESVETVQIPHTDITHSLIMIKKICQTPTRYPRKSVKIKKEPIK